MTSAEEAPDMSEDVTDGDVRTEEITARNGRESPLLRLPAELREMIWGYAFGRQTVHPRGNGTHSWASKDWRITHFDPCRGPLSDRELYAFNQQAALEQRPEVVYPQSVPVDDTGLHLHCSEHTNATLPRQLVPPVCKQITHEAVPSAWRTTVFVFESPTDLVCFYMSSDTPLSLVNHITLVLWVHVRELRYWTVCLRDLPVASFTALRGLNIVLPAVVPDSTDFVLESYLYPVYEIILRCREIRLQEDQTTVLLVNYPHLAHLPPPQTRLAFPKRVASAETMRTLMLQKKVVKTALQPK